MEPIIRDEALHCKACDAPMGKTPDLRGELCFDCYLAAKTVFEDVHLHLIELEKYFKMEKEGWELDEQERHEVDEGEEDEA